jgi:hypothetical protein
MSIDSLPNWVRTIAIALTTTAVVSAVGFSIKAERGMAMLEERSISREEYTDLCTNIARLQEGMIQLDKRNGRIEDLLTQIVRKTQ